MSKWLLRSVRANICRCLVTLWHTACRLDNTVCPPRPGLSLNVECVPAMSPCWLLLAALALAGADYHAPCSAPACTRHQPCASCRPRPVDCQDRADFFSIL